MPEPTVAIIGAGIQGVCTALALNRIGARVVLIDAASTPLDRASFRSEGKIHLGFVYASDPTAKTAGLMLESAFHFAPLIDDWIGPVDWHTLRSRPFAYATLPDSQLSIDQLQEHYERVDAEYRETYRFSGLHYLGWRPDTLLTRRSGYTAAHSSGWLARGEVVAHTAETALDLGALRNHLCAAVAAAPGISLRTGHYVEDIDRTGAGFTVSGFDPSGAYWDQQVAIVVNCSWTDRLRLDQQVGLEPDRKWVYRLKYRVMGRLSGASERSSITFALGPYGDVVTYRDDRVYLSWYPVCLRGWSQELAPPADWEDACSGHAVPDAAEIAAAVKDEFGAIMPALRDTCVGDVDAGVIFSWGSQDIDKPASELHRRSDIGVEGGNGYYSINTGKFTCAPLFANRLVDRLRADGGLD